MLPTRQFVAEPAKVPLMVRVLAPIDNLPEVSVTAVLTTNGLPSVAVPPPFIRKVTIWFVVPGVPWLKNKVPSAPVAAMVRLDDALPVKKSVADIPATVPLSVNVRAPMVSVLLAPVNVSVPVIVGLPDNVYALVEAQLNSRLPSVAPETLCAIPVMVILPPVVLVCVPVPVILPWSVITWPPSAMVPLVSASVVATINGLPIVALPPTPFIVNVCIVRVAALV